MRSNERNYSISQERSFNQSREIIWSIERDHSISQERSFNKWREIICSVGRDHMIGRCRSWDQTREIIQSVERDHTIRWERSYDQMGEIIRSVEREHANRRERSVIQSVARDHIFGWERSYDQMREIFRSDKKEHAIMIMIVIIKICAQTIECKIISPNDIKYLFFYTCKSLLIIRSVTRLVIRSVMQEIIQSVEGDHSISREKIVILWSQLQHSFQLRFFLQNRSFFSGEIEIICFINAYIHIVLCVILFSFQIDKYIPQNCWHYFYKCMVSVTSCSK